MNGLKKKVSFEGLEPTTYVLLSNDFMSVELLSLGATMLAINMPDQRGITENILLSHDELKAYYHNEDFYGVTVGPYAGRIEKGEMQIDGISYALEINEKISHLHSGTKGFQQVNWNVSEFIRTPESIAVIFSHEHVHMEEGYPGNYTVKETVTLDRHNHLTVRIEAVSDRKTVLNMTNHNYYNLSGHHQRPIYDQTLFVNALKMHAIDDNDLPIWPAHLLRGTRFDFTRMNKIGQAVFQEEDGGIYGIDNPFRIDEPVDINEPAIIYKDRISGRQMTMDSNQPVVVIYTTNREKQMHRGICFEMQRCPNQMHYLEANTPYVNEMKISFNIDE